jgi:hypothetical protein
VRVQFSSGADRLRLIMGDNAGVDQVTFDDSDGTGVAYVDSDGNLYAASHGSIGGAAVDADTVLRVRDTAVSFAGTTFYGLNNYVIKTAGASTNADDFIGLWSQVQLNQMVAGAV